MSNPHDQLISEKQKNKNFLQKHKPIVMSTPTAHPTSNKLLTISEAAKFLNVSSKTLRRWERAGLIKPSRNSQNQRLYSLEQLLPLLNRKYQPLPEKASAHSLDNNLQLLTISQAAQNLGVSLKTIRRWNQENLISSQRNEHNHRVFSAQEVNRVKQLRAQGNFFPSSLPQPSITPTLILPTPPPIHLGNKSQGPRLRPRDFAFLGGLAIILSLFSAFGIKQYQSASSSTLVQAQPATSSAKPSFLSRILGITTFNDSGLTFQGVIDSDFNFGVAGTIEGSQLISSTTNQTPLIVSSTTRVPNLNADLLDGKHLSQIEAQIASSNNLQTAYIAGPTINTTSSDLVFNFTDQSIDADFKINLLGNQSTLDITGNSGENILNIQPNSAYPVVISKATNLTGTLLLGGPLVSSGTLTLDDANTTSAIPLSDASNTSLPSGRTSILDALNNPSGK